MTSPRGSKIMKFGKKPGHNYMVRIQQKSDTCKVLVLFNRLEKRTDHNEPTDAINTRIIIYCKLGSVVRNSV